MGKLTELEAQITPGEKVEAPDEVPEERRTFERKPEPGDGYVFRLPETFDWKAFKVERNGKQVTRLSASFFGESELTVVSAPDPQFNGRIIRTSISTLERARGKRGQQKEVSDIHYLLLALRESPEAIKKAVKTPLDWGKLLEKHAGETFEGSVEWNARCRSDKIRFVQVQDESGNVSTVEDPSGNFGCGRRLWQRDIHQEQAFDREGNPYMRWPYAVTCPDCGANLIPDLSVCNFRPYEGF